MNDDHFTNEILQVHKKEKKVTPLGVCLPLLIDLTGRLLNVSYALLGCTIKPEIKRTFSDNPQE